MQKYVYTRIFIVRESLRSQYQKHLSKRKTKSGQTATKIINQYRSQLTFIDENSDEEDWYKEIHVEKDSQERIETTTLFQNNDDCEYQSNPNKTVLVYKKQKPYANANQESASTTLMKYLIEKKEKEKNNISHSVDNFFSLMATTVKTFSSMDQRYVKTKIFATVNDMEAKYVLQPPTYFTSIFHIHKFCTISTTVFRTI